ncbi:NAD(P)H-hydrate dehydratase [Sphingomonas crocodyli]|uniref:ADP-dependent (S)-NAD(P)H-hydrate dehydratase n=1 Tax=Sphingomonas crocodyli TaxID=1979270 RepID=A0A437M5B9_9SPHN|nr:NAD(P)H-hydrate dehydratase [Sphingomonas crocodyli]RVT92773.1 NAD(P)H-hydrate dehydratase [Sphingomonas crocodyli]
MIEALDRGWLEAHPLPRVESSDDKNDRGRVLLVGGGAFVPGALRLTAEAVLRVGAGKLQMATVASAAMALGVLVPEAAMIALPADAGGEIAADAADHIADLVVRCDTLILGPGMIEGEGTVELVTRALATPRDDCSILLDAAAISCAGNLASAIAAHEGRIVLTPHHGEMAALTGHKRDHVAEDPATIAQEVADRFGAVVVLKAARTIIAAPGASPLVHASNCPGLGTGGSGDVLAGVIGGLLARGLGPRAAAAWGVWLHGAAGRIAADKIGPIGFLARDLPPELPGLLPK